MTPVLSSPVLSIAIPKKYDVVYIDCPWSYFGDPNKMGAAGKEYNLMTQTDINGLDIKSLLKKDAYVFVWATCPRLNFAIETIKAWGLHYRGVAYVWVKTNKAGKIINGQGVPPTYTKPTSELLLVATTRKAGRPVKLLKHNTPQIILAGRGKHSEKPELVRQSIEQTLGREHNMLEIFARKTSAWWDSIGNELTGEDIRITIGKLNGSVACVPATTSIIQVP